MNFLYNKFKTDMADERVDEYKKKNNLTDVDGISIKEDNALEFAKVVEVEILNEYASQLIDKEIGKYITIECSELNYLDEKQKHELKEKISEIILSLIKDKKSSIMVVGLGNYNITPDALGAKVSSKVEVTRHLFKLASHLVNRETREISSICPGVIGSTGIQTLDIIESVVMKVKPDVLIVVDSLMSQSIQRLGKTIQITDRGIIPGGGVGNANSGKISEETLNIPVISIGVPLVVEASTITIECMQIVNNKLGKSEEDYSKIKENLMQEDCDMIVVPKDIDELLNNCSSIIADAINNI